MSSAAATPDPVAAGEPLIHLQGVTRVYLVGDSEVRALDGVDLRIDHGEFVAIIGPSGSGKSTLMYLLGCLDRPTDGSYRLAGREIAHASDSDLSRVRNRAIGYVFQSYNLLPHLTVTGNIALGLVYAGVEAEHREAVAADFARRFGIGHRLDHRPLELSGGQMQRVAIARGLASHPHLILADEPTGNLDSKTGAEILQTFKKLHAEGHTIVLVTHDPGVAAQAARVIRIVDGRIVSDERNAPPVPMAPPPAEDDQRPGVRWSDILAMAVREGLLAHKLRTLLTMLGIVFGIAAVISMTAITEGGKAEQLRQLRQIGQNSIQIRSLDLEGSRLARVRRLNPEGLTPADLDQVRTFFDREAAISAATATKGLKAELRRGGRAVDWAGVIGVLGSFQEVVGFHVAHGRFLDDEDERGRRRVCVLGAAVAEALEIDPAALGSVVVVGDEPFTVVGIMERKAYSSGGVSDVSVVDRNREVYLPHGSLRAYFRHLDRDSPLDAISLRMTGDERLLEQSELIRRMIGELHHGAADFAISVPLEALRQAQRTKEVFNVIIVVIAAISLVVGGIGIMNIMLASVTERTREIGIRRAIGASRRDILRQFLTEALLIAACGGVLGLVMGVGSGLLIQAVFSFPVAFNGWIMAVATVTSMLIGIGFGLYPAWKAARMDPVEALRT